MADAHRTRFFLYDGTTPVAAENAVWRKALPIALPAAASTDFSADAVSYGDCFEAIFSMLEADGRRRLQAAAACLTGRNIAPDAIKEIRIYAEKHGAFYHPFRIEALAAEANCGLAANVAVSEAGRRIVQDELRLLNLLQRSGCGADRIPRAFACQRMKTASGVEIAVLLTEWLDGYCEFHLGMDPADGALKTILWRRSDADVVALTPEQAFDAYRGAACLLTCFYDLGNTRQIQSWHHAAGDFVLRPLSGEAVDVRLITVRRFEPMLKSAPAPGTEADALLVFLLDLSIRNRMDRVNGTGAFAWADAFVADATVAGFADGLRKQQDSGRIPEEFVGAFFRYLCNHAESELESLFEALIERFPEDMPGRILACEHRKAHAAEFYAALDPIRRIADAGCASKSK